VAAVLEPISPELALVCPDLRLRALEQARKHAELADLRRLFDDAEEREAQTIETRPLAVRLALYTGHQLATGAVVGFGAVAAAAGALLALALVAQAL
jgi:hypothetical protein